jgi:hypothetical protein
MLRQSPAPRFAERAEGRRQRRHMEYWRTEWARQRIEGAASLTSPALPGMQGVIGRTVDVRELVPDAAEL